MNSSVCVDANLILRTLVPGPLSGQAISLLEKWEDDQTTLIAPTFFAYEVTSTLRRLVHLKQINPFQGDRAFEKFLQFPIRLSHRPEILLLAWELAKEFDRPRAYDTAYLALAQLQGCEFWTADERLYNAVGEHLDWVKWIGDYQEN